MPQIAAAPRALTGAALDSPKALHFASRVAVVLSSDHISRPKYFDARAFSGVRARSWNCSNKIHTDAAAGDADTERSGAFILNVLEQSGAGGGQGNAIGGSIMHFSRMGMTDLSDSSVSFIYRYRWRNVNEQFSHAPFRATNWCVGSRKWDDKCEIYSNLPQPCTTGFETNNICVSGVFPCQLQKLIHFPVEICVHLH